MSDTNSLPVYSYPDEVARKWKEERDKFKAAAEMMAEALEFIGCQGFRAKRSECTCTRCKALSNYAKIKGGGV